MLKPFVNAAVVLSLLAPVALQAQEEGAAEEEAPAQTGPRQAKAEKEAQTAVTDVVGYKFPRGIYTTADLGVFWRYLGFADTGGNNQCYRCRYPTYFVSNAQPFIGISVGYDILPTIFDFMPNVKVPDIVKRFGISAQMNLGTGYVANAAPWSAARSNTLGTKARPEESPKDHAILMAHPSLLFNFVPPPFERVVLEARVFAGLSAFTPSVQRIEGRKNQGPLADPNWWLGTFGINSGFGLSFKYMTLLTNFVVGSDLAMYHILSPGYGTEFFIPPVGRRIDATDCAPSYAGVCSKNGKTNLLLPVSMATSFSPIIIKYVF
ncbi:MAG: hypothetical protein HY904_09550 [Deltaproteobacteria bacterium]|nr:hypothetical protein [Deltaproteobacteria bacterium]